MYYQLRDLTRGNAHPNSGGNLTSLMGTQSAITPQQMRLEEQTFWQAPDGKAICHRLACGFFRRMTG